MTILTNIIKRQSHTQPGGSYRHISTILLVFWVILVLESLQSIVDKHKT